MRVVVSHKDVHFVDPAELNQPVLGEKARTLPELTTQQELDSVETSSTVFGKLMCGLNLLLRAGAFRSAQSNRSRSEVTTGGSAFGSLKARLVVRCNW
jgi:hypothetical protein